MAKIDLGYIRINGRFWKPDPLFGTTETVADAGLFPRERYEATKKKLPDLGDHDGFVFEHVRWENEDIYSRAAEAINPKDKVGVTKAPLDYFPPVAILQASRAMKHGADKYGRANWRDYPIQRTIYLGAALRHIAADLDGETIDPETITPENPEGTPHLALALAGLGIALDADAIGNLIDDRPKKGGYADLARKLFSPKESK